MAAGARNGSVRPRRPGADAGREVGERQGGVADQAVADRGFRSDGRVVGYVKERRPCRKIGSRNVRVVAEHLRAHDQHEVVPGELLGQRPDGRRQRSLEQRMGFGKRRALREGRGPDRRAELLRERDSGAPRVAAGDVGTVDENRITALRRYALQTPGCARDRAPAAWRRCGRRRPPGCASPSRRGEATIDRPRRLLQRRRIRAHEGGGDIFRARRFVAPLDPWARQQGRVDVGEQRLDQQHVTGLLSRRHDERRFVEEGCDDRAHGVAGSRSGVQVDQNGAPEALGKPIRDGDRARLLKGEHVVEVGREIGEKRLLGRTGIPDDGGQLQLSQKVECDFANSAHGFPSLVGVLSLHEEPRLSALACKAALAHDLADLKMIVQVERFPPRAPAWPPGWLAQPRSVSAGGSILVRCGRPFTKCIQ